MKLNCAGYGPVVPPRDAARFRFGLAAAILAAGLFSAPIANANDDPRELKLFVGKYPFDRVSGVCKGGCSLLQMRGLRLRLQILLGMAGVNDIDQLTVGTPVEEHSGWIVAHGCRPHNCGEEQWTVAVNLSDYSVRACLGIEGQPVRYAAIGRKPVEQPPKKEHPCPETADAVPAFERVFASR